jgi:hypothetical protein
VVVVLLLLVHAALVGVPSRSGLVVAANFLCGLAEREELQLHTYLVAAGQVAAEALVVILTA